MARTLPQDALENVVEFGSHQDAAMLAQTCKLYRECLTSDLGYTLYAWTPEDIIVSPAMLTWALQTQGRSVETMKPKPKQMVREAIAGFGLVDLAKSLPPEIWEFPFQDLGPYVTNPVVTKAAAGGHVPFLEWLCAPVPFTSYELLNAGWNAVCNGHADVLRWCARQPNYVAGDVLHVGLKGCITGNCFDDVCDTLRELESPYLDDEEWDNFIMDTLFYAATPKPEVLPPVYNHMHSDEAREKFRSRLAKFENMFASERPAEMFGWLHNVLGDVGPLMTKRWFLKNADPYMLSVAREQGFQWDSPDALKHAINGNNWKVVDWLCRETELPKLVDPEDHGMIMAMAADNNDIAAIERSWSVVRQGTRFDFGKVYHIMGMQFLSMSAASFGHVHVLDWMRAQVGNTSQAEDYRDVVITSAAEYGCVSAVQWAIQWDVSAPISLDSAIESASSTAARADTSPDHRTILMIFHDDPQIRVIVNWVRVAQAAAGRNQLKTLKWLVCESAIEWVSKIDIFTNVVKEAGVKGHLRVVVWAYGHFKKYREFFPKDAEGMFSDQPHILRWMRQLTSHVDT